MSDNATATVAKCSLCGVAVGEFQAGGNGNARVLCGECWAAFEVRDELCRASQPLASAPTPPARDTQIMKANRDLETTVIELQTRLSLAEEGKSAAEREKQIAAEGRGKAEKTLSEFLAKFSAVRNGEASAQKERDHALNSCRAMEKKLAELTTELTLAQETEAAAMTERNTEAQMRAEQELRLEDLKKQLNSSQEALERERVAANGRKALDVRVSELESLLAQAREAEADTSREKSRLAKTSADLEASVAALNAKLAEVQKDLNASRDTAAEAQRQLEQKLGTLQAELTTSQSERAAIVAERDMAISARQEIAAKVEDLQERLARAQEAQAKAFKERDEASVSLEHEHQLAEQASADLSRLRETAVSVLEPLGIECGRSMKDLVAEAERVLSDARAARDEAAQRMEDFEKTVGQLKENINAARRNITGRVSLVLGLPANESQLQQAVVVPANSSGDQKAVHAAGE